MDFFGDPANLTLGSILVGSFIIGLSGAVMPGPVLAVTITHAARRGPWAGPLLVGGHAILEAALLLALAAGLGPFITRPMVKGTIGAVGAVILVWMAVGMLRALGNLRLDLEPGQKSGRGPVIDGILLSLANPYWVLWWATVGLSMMAVAGERGWLGLVAFYIGHIFADLGWYSAVSLVVAKGRRLLTDGMYRWLVGICAGFLVLFGLYFGWFAWQALAGTA